MKTTILAICMSFFATATLAAGTMTKDSSKNPVQAFCPDYSLSALLTVNSTWKSLSGKLYWSVYVPTVSTCKYRLTPTQAKGSYPQMTIPAATSVGRGVNYNLDGTVKTGFVNYSGCTDGEYEAQ